MNKYIVTFDCKIGGAIPVPARNEDKAVSHAIDYCIERHVDNGGAFDSPEVYALENCEYTVTEYVKGKNAEHDATCAEWDVFFTALDTHFAQKMSS